MCLLDESKQYGQSCKFSITCQVILPSKCIAKAVWKHFSALEQKPGSLSSFSIHFSFINPISEMSAKPVAFNESLLTKLSPQSIISFDRV